MKTFFKKKLTLKKDKISLKQKKKILQKKISWELILQIFAQSFGTNFRAF